MSEALLHMEHKVSMHDSPLFIIFVERVFHCGNCVQPSSEPVFRNTLFLLLHFAQAFEIQHDDLIMED